MAVPNERPPPTEDDPEEVMDDIMHDELED
jgi:hypothetical protein